MSKYRREGFPGRTFETRQSDFQCPRIDPCGYRCGAGQGGHDGPHLFEEHSPPAPALDARLLSLALQTIHGSIVPLPNRPTPREYAEMIARWYADAALTEPYAAGHDQTLDPQEYQRIFRSHVPHGNEGYCYCGKFHCGEAQDA